MRQSGKRILSEMLVAVMLISLVPCQTQAATTKKTKLNKTTLTMYVGQKKTLKLKNYTKLSTSKIKKVKWKSSNKNVATVTYKGTYRQKAVVTAKNAGKATIRVKYNGKVYKCKVTVKDTENTTDTTAQTTQSTEQTTTEQGTTQAAGGNTPGQNPPGSNGDNSDRPTPPDNQNPGGSGTTTEITDDASLDYEKSTEITITEEEKSTDETGAVTLDLDSELTGKKHDVEVDGTVVASVSKKNKLTITQPGTYILSGGTEAAPLDALIEVELAEDAETEAAQVHLILDGLYLTSSNLEEPDKDKGLIMIKQNDSTPQLTSAILTVKAGSTNVLTDVGTCGTETEDDGTTSTTYTAGIICKKTPLVINGTGSLAITSLNGNGIKCTDSLKIADATITVGTEEKPTGHNGITGKTALATDSANLTVYATNDALKTTLDEDDVAEDSSLAELGNIDIEGGSYSISSVDGDGISAYRTLLLNPQSMDVTTQIVGTPTSDGSHKCIKAGTTIDVPATAGTFTLDSSKTYSASRASGDSNDSYADDTLHCDGYIRIEGGTFDITSGDDGVHADKGLVVNGGNITIRECYEGLEAADITIAENASDNPVINITSRDDGLNAAGGSDSTSSGSNPSFGPGDHFGSKDDNAGSSDYQIIINGGILTIDAEGDGIDSNGNLFITGGTITVNGPSNGGNGALDYGEGSCICQITGGTLVAAGRSDMAVTPTGYGQNVLAITFTSLQAANQEIAVKDSSGNTVIAATPTKSYNHIVLSAQGLKQGETYTIYVGSTAYQTVTLSTSSYNTTVGSQNSNNRPGGRR